MKLSEALLAADAVRETAQPIFFSPFLKRGPLRW